MQLRRRWSDDVTWLVVTAQAGAATGFLAPPAAANDAMPGGRPRARSGSADMLAAIKKAASWLLAETIFGLSVCAASAYPSVLHPSWSPYQREPAETSARSLD